MEEQKMKEQVKSRIKKESILTIPNLMSVFRLILIPVIVWLYLKEDYNKTIAVVAISALTDILDGKIARAFHMVSDVGKVLDPIADKLTQGAMIFCLVSRYPLLWLIVAFFIIKEATMLYWGFQVLKVTDKVNSAKWYGKLSTVVLYSVMAVLIFFTEIPYSAANILIGLCGAVMVMSLILYGRFYYGILKKSCL